MSCSFHKSQLPIDSQPCLERNILSTFYIMAFVTVFCLFLTLCFPILAWNIDRTHEQKLLSGTNGGEPTLRVMQAILAMKPMDNGEERYIELSIGQNISAGM